MAELRFEPFPETFERKGEYRVYDRQWNFTGFSKDPQYAGQMPVTYPLDATPFECFLGGCLLPSE